MQIKFFGWILGSISLLILFRLSLATVTTAVAAVPEQPPECAEIYFVQWDDTLSKIANKFLGDIEAYPAILAATNLHAEADASFAHITNPDEIEIGWKVCIPVKEAAEALLAEAVVAAASYRRSVPTSPPKTVSVEPYTLDDYVAEHSFSRQVKAAWIYESPERLSRFEIPGDYHARFNAYGYRANYFWNEFLSDGYFTDSGIFDALPAEVWVYRAPWGSAFPRYRYPPNVTLPTGLTTNAFGWRGGSINFDKPLRTIRIACVGASTTVSGHGYYHSYPELLQHWLNLWAEEQGYSLKFEVINAGREGIGSIDIASVVRHEILPMDVDYIIYYEGANQFTVQTMVKYADDIVFGEPPAGLVPHAANIEAEDKSLLDQLSEYSALAARARNIVEQFLYTGEEPPKPEQTFFLPKGQNEFAPRRENLGEALALRKILNHLDQIKADVDQKEIKLFIGTFDWFAYDDMVLDPGRHRNLYIYLNRVYWPVTYANMRRMADYQNRVFRRWAADNQVPVIDVAGQMPRQPDLYGDAIHNTPLGVRIRAWINFEAILPSLEKDIEAGLLPRRDQVFLKEHPYIQPGHKIKPFGSLQKQN